jgi:hypothetical protein
MIDFKIDVKGDTALLARLDKLPEELQAKLRPVIESLTTRLLESVRAAEPARTGTLRSVTRASVVSGKDYIRGRVRIGARSGRRNGAYNVAAAALEYGVHSAFAVHLRSRGRMTTYTRRVSISARRFLRDPFARMKPIAEAAIARALSEKLEP